MWMVGRSSGFGNVANLAISPISNSGVNSAVTTTFTPTGLVGVGTVTPTYKLDVFGQTRINNNGDNLILQGAAGTGVTGTLGIPGTSPSSLTITWGDGSGWYTYFRGNANRAGQNIMAMVDSTGNVGINSNTPAYTLDVNGLGRTRIIISTVTTNMTFAANSFGTYYNLSNTGITAATLPTLAAADNGWFVVLRNNTSVTLNVSWGATFTGLPASSNTIPASNSVTVTWNGSAFILF
jgi:hypothetical protein